MGEKSKKQRKSKRRINCEICSQYEYKDPDTGEQIVKTEEEILKKVKQLVEEETVAKYVYMRHDKDTYEEDDMKCAPEDAQIGDHKKPHFHLFLSFNKQYYYYEVGEWFGVKENYVNVLRTSFDNACLYAVHANAPTKYQYDPATAVWGSSALCADFDFLKLVENYLLKREKKKSRDALNAERIDIITRIADGEITKFNVHEMLTPLQWDTHNRNIKLAFERYEDIKANEQERQLECIYISGKTNTRKSTLAYMMGLSLGASVALLNGGSTDPFGSYQGQEVAIINDIDFSTFSWKSFLNLTDPHYNTKVKSRFHDVAVYAKYIIITTTKDPVELVAKMKDAQDEDKKQFYRRFKYFFKMSKETTEQYIYDDTDPDNMHYKKVDKFKNTTLLATVEKEEIEKKGSEKKIPDAREAVRAYCKEYNLTETLKVLEAEDAERAERKGEEPSELDDGWEEIEDAENVFYDPSEETKEFLGTDTQLSLFDLVGEKS